MYFWKSNIKILQVLHAIICFHSPLKVKWKAVLRAANLPSSLQVIFLVMLNSCKIRIMAKKCSVSFLSKVFQIVPFSEISLETNKKHLILSSVTRKVQISQWNREIPWSRCMVVSLGEVFWDDKFYLWGGNILNDGIICAKTFFGETLIPKEFTNKKSFIYSKNSRILEHMYSVIHRGYHAGQCSEMLFKMLRVAEMGQNSWKST